MAVVAVVVYASSLLCTWNQPLHTAQFKWCPFSGRHCCCCCCCWSVFLSELCVLHLFTHFHSSKREEEWAWLTDWLTTAKESDAASLCCGCVFPFCFFFLKPKPITNNLPPPAVSITEVRDEHKVELSRQFNQQQQKTAFIIYEKRVHFGPAAQIEFLSHWCCCFPISQLFPLSCFLRLTLG